ncbi:MAG: autotransporter domain-containing protein [Pseudomonadota bacterium]|nr:autotransporter domain-containing protein [Pseudomonadota bacterium]
MRNTWVWRLRLALVLLLSVSGSALAQSSVIVAPATLPDGAIGLAYDETITASGTTGPYTFSVTTGGPLPPGLTLASNGDLSGTPTTVGTYSFTIMAMDGASNGFQSYTVEIFPEATIEPPDLATAQVGVPYEQQVTVVNGGAPGYNFAVGSGALPTGLSLASDGWITGTPTVAGDANFTITASPTILIDGGMFAPTAAPVVTLSRGYTLSVVPAAIVLSPAFLPDATVGEAYSRSITASGGLAPYTFTAGSGLPPGITLASDGELSGTPTSPGDYSFVVHATDSLGASGGQAYDLAVEPPPLTLPVGGVPGGVEGAAYEYQFEATGGYPPYSYYADASLPPGLVLEEDGTLHGTPTADGNYSFEVMAYDSSEASTSRLYGISITEMSPAPVAVDDDATTPSQQAVAIGVVDNDSGTIETIAITTAPAHGTASVDGLTVVYQPTGTFHGDDSFTYTATGPGGTSSPATVVVHVTPLAAPTGAPQAVSTQPGVAVTIHAADGASGAPITEVTIVDAPATGSIEQSGTDIVYTPAVDVLPGTVIPLDYTLSNDYGVSATVTSTVTIEAAPVSLPEPMALETTTETGVAVSVELTSGASGGPFVAAELLALSPQEAGSASIATSADGFSLTFIPASGYIGVAVASFTLSNTGGTSEPATLTITVTERPDPTDDPEVGGLAGAQVQIVRSFSNAQILNVINRLEQLHEPGKPLSFWIGGSIRKGDSPGREFETSGMTGGMDYRFSDKFAFGGGLGYGRDRSMTGNNGSRADARSRTGMGYASYRPSLPWFIDMVSGYQRITFQLRRFVTDTGDMLEAPRDGTQGFSSWSSGYEHKGDKWMFSTYGRMDIAQAKLDEYSEDGAPLYALSFAEQSIQTRTSTLGVRGKYKREIPWGTLEPRFRVELQRDFHDESGAAIAYSDLQSGPVYVLPGDELDSSRYIIEIGTIFKSKWGFVMRLDYRGVRGGVYDDDNAIMFSFQDDH